MATADFRNYWAGPHAALALGMDGISKYTHNRVDKVLWASAEKPVYDIDGIVELHFKDAEAMRLAQASAVGQEYIPADEPIFLKGWTLCVVETDGEEPTNLSRKVIVPFHASPEERDELWRDLSRLAVSDRVLATLNWTVSTAKRDRLWAEPNPPAGFICIWFESVAKAHEAFEPTSDLCHLIESHVSDAAAYLIDVRRIR